MSIKLKGSSDGSVSFDAPADTSPSGSDITLTLPTSAGSANQFLKNSGIAGELEYSSMVETSTGVGIGTSAPSELLHIAGATNPAITLQDTTNNTDARIKTNNSGDLVFEADYNNEQSDSRIGFELDGSEKARFDSSGTLKIGGTANLGSQRLQIHGNDENTADIIIANSTASTGESSKITFAPANSVTGARIQCVAEEDFSTGANRTARLEFYTRKDGTLAERMQITSSGAVRIGDDLTANAAGRFQVVEERTTGDDNDCNAYFETARQDWNIKTYYNRAGTHYHLVFIEQGTERGSISGNDGSNVTFNQGSDYRWKENIVEMTGTEGIEICKRLKPSKYNWIENREQTGEINTVDGFIAHEVVEAGVLGAVVGEKDAVNEDGSIKGQLLDYGQMTPVLSAGIKGLIAKVETLETQNTAQQAQIDDLLARVTALEAA